MSAFQDGDGNIMIEIHSVEFQNLHSKNAQQEISIDCVIAFKKICIRKDCMLKIISLLKKIISFKRNWMKGTFKSVSR